MESFQDCIQFGDPNLDRQIEFQSAMVNTGINVDAYRHLFCVMDDVTGSPSTNFDDIILKRTEIK